MLREVRRSERRRRSSSALRIRRGMAARPLVRWSTDSHGGSRAPTRSAGSSSCSASSSCWSQSAAPDAFRGRERARRARTRRSTTSIASSAAATRCCPIRAIAIEAAGGSRRTGRSRVDVGEPQASWSDLATPDALETYMRYFLLPRRPRDDAPWILCFALRPRRVSRARRSVWEDATRRSRSCRRSRDVRAHRRARRAERRVRRRRARPPLGGPGLPHVGRRRCGCAGSATCSASPRSASSGRSSSSSASRSAASKSSSRSSLSPRGGLVAGRCLRRGRCRAAASRARAPRRRRARDRRRDRRSPGSLLEALFRAARLQSLQAYDAWAFWVPKAKAIYFFGGLDEQVFTTAPGPSYPPLAADPRRRVVPRDGRRRRRHAARPVLVPRRSAASPRSPAASTGGVPAWLLWPSLAARPRRAALRRAAAWRPRPTSSSTCFFVVGALLVALWLRRGPRWRLARGRGAARGARRSRSAKGSCSPPACSSPALVASLGRAPAGLARGSARVGRRRRRGRPPVAALVPGLATSRATRRRRTDAGLDRLWDALRLSFEVLYSTRALVGVPVVATIALARGVRLGRSPARGLRRRRARPRLPRRRLGDLRLRRAAGHGGRVREPDRALHGGDRAPRRRRDAAPAASVWRRRERRRMTERLLVARGRADRRGAAPRLPGARRLPTERASRPATTACASPRRARPSARPRLRPARHAGGGRGAARAGRRRGLRRRRGRGDGCGRWKVLYDGIESYEQGLESRAEARGAGLEAELEIEPPG